MRISQILKTEMKGKSSKKENNNDKNKYNSLISQRLFWAFLWFAVLALQPNTVHLELSHPVHNQTPVHRVVLNHKPSSLHQRLDLLLREEVHPRSVPSHIKVIRQQVTILESQLCKIIPPIITEQKQPSRFQGLFVGFTRSEIIWGVKQSWQAIDHHTKGQRKRERRRRKRKRKRQHKP